MATHFIGNNLALIYTLTFAILTDNVNSCWHASTDKTDHIGTANSGFRIRGRWIVDESGRVRLFHGFNSILKGPPYIDHRIVTNSTRVELLRQWGFNVVRLGAMWAGVEPSRPDHYNETYVAELVNAVELFGSRGIYVILDMHQVGSSRFLIGLVRRRR